MWEVFQVPYHIPYHEWNADEANTTSFKRFSDLPLSSKTLRGLKECDYEEPTDIQRESLPFSLSGLDVVGVGISLEVGWSELLWSGRINNFSYQRACPSNVYCHKSRTDVEYEKSRLGRVNIIICTPGRLLQHMDENEQLLCDELQIKTKKKLTNIVLTRKNRILDMGSMLLLRICPKERQTLLFSATQTRNIKDLTRVCTKDPVFVSAHERCAHVTPDCLVQSYMVCEPD
ncbi:hypothetical protein OSTOST_07704 [Ostertagia ostertagi]